MRKINSRLFTILWRGYEIKGTATYYPGRPGVLSGPPEKCYPPEDDELVVEELTLDGHPAQFLMDGDLAEDIDDVVFNTLFNHDHEDDSPEFEPDEPSDMTDVEADADTLKSAGYGTDEDYGLFDDPS